MFYNQAIFRNLIIKLKHEPLSVVGALLVLWLVLLLANPLRYKAIVEFPKCAEGLNSHAFRQANCCEQS